MGADTLAGTTSASLSDAPPAAGSPTEDKLMGADPATLEHWLGKPRLVRLDDPAQVWQYRGDGCVVDVYLYPTAGRMAVTLAGARSEKSRAPPTPPSLALLSPSRRKV